MHSFRGVALLVYHKHIDYLQVVRRTHCWTTRSSWDFWRQITEWKNLTCAQKLCKLDIVMSLVSTFVVLFFSHRLQMTSWTRTPHTSRRRVCQRSPYHILTPSVIYNWKGQWENCIYFFYTMTETFTSLYRSLKALIYKINTCIYFTVTHNKSSPFRRWISHGDKSSAHGAKIGFTTN